LLVEGADLTSQMAPRSQHRSHNRFDFRTVGDQAQRSSSSRTVRRGIPVRRTISRTGSPASCFILNISRTWRIGVSASSAPPRYQLDARLNGPGSNSSRRDLG
jgi:hypothetical protein